MLLMLSITSCDSYENTRSHRKVKVVATSYILASVAREIGQDMVDLDWIIESGDPIIDLHPNTSQRNRLMNAEFILCDGGHSESWAADQFTSPEMQSRLLTLDSLPGTRMLAVNETGLMWLDPLVVRDAATEIATHLASRNPDAGDKFRANADIFSAKINELIGEFPRRPLSSPVMVLDGRWNIMLKRFGIEAVRLDIDPLSMTEDEGIRISKTARTKGITHLILPMDTPPARVDEIRRLTHMKTLILDSVGLKSLDGHRTYIEIMRYNLTQLSQATISTATSQSSDK